MTRPGWTLAICADDFALSPGVSAGIVELIEAGRLSATSCMVAQPFWPAHAPMARAVADRADIGLHLTLTDQQPLGSMPRLAPDGRLPPVGTLIRRAYTGALDAAEIGAEIERQLDRFEEHFGAPPAHVDGHQHVHLLPVIRARLLAALARRYPGRMPWLRHTGEAPDRIVRRGVAVAKSLFLGVLATGLQRQAARHGMACSHSFRGIYGFEADADYARLFAAFLAPPVDGALLMVHPAQADRELGRFDPVVEPRWREREFLASTPCGDLLAAAGARVARLSSWSPSASSAG